MYERYPVDSPIHFPLRKLEMIIVLTTIGTLGTWAGPVMLTPSIS